MSLEKKGSVCKSLFSNSKVFPFIKPHSLGSLLLKRIFRLLFKLKRGFLRLSHFFLRLYLLFAKAYILKGFALCKIFIDNFIYLAVGKKVRTTARNRHNGV